MFDWVLNTPLRGVLEEFCKIAVIKEASQKAKDTCKEKLLIHFPCEIKVAC